MASAATTHPTYVHDRRIRREKLTLFPGTAREGVHCYHPFRASTLGANFLGASNNAILIGYPAFPMHKAGSGSAHQLDNPSVGREFCADHTLAGRAEKEQPQKRTVELGKTFVYKRYGSLLCCRLCVREACDNRICLSCFFLSFTK